MGDIDGDLAEAQAAALGSEAFGTRVDITDEASFSALLDATEDRFGPIDVLVNNAGIADRLLLDEPADLARRASLINVSGAGCRDGCSSSSSWLPAMPTPGRSRDRRLRPRSEPPRAGAGVPIGPSLRSNRRRRTSLFVHSD